jgi:hypothetical protein
MHWDHQKQVDPRNGEVKIITNNTSGGDFGSIYPLTTASPDILYKFHWTPQSIQSTANDNAHNTYQYVEAGQGNIGVGKNRLLSTNPYIFTPADTRNSNSPNPFNERFFLILSMAVFQPPFQTPWQKFMEVDYVRVYQQDPGRTITVYGNDFDLGSHLTQRGSETE